MPQLRPTSAYPGQLRDHPEASDQIAYADHIVLNHCDRCAPEDVDRAEAAVRSCQPHATVRRTSHAQVDVASLFATRTWGAVDWEHNSGRDAESQDNMPRATHTHGVSAISLRTERAVDLDRLQMWLRDLLDHPDTDIMRIKGIVRCPQHREALIVQGVYQWLEMRLGAERGPQTSMLVMIGRGLDEAAARQGWADCQEGA